MCGIYGIYGRNPSAQIDPEWLTLMGSRLAYRGPDDQGSYLDNRIALGHRRLSIVDIASGHQPLTNESETIWLTYNGEIYNYQELNQSLLKKKHTIRTNCDSETLVHLYEEYGQSFLEKINGMFAFAIWDRQHGKLLLARDRLGIKPLYYYCDEEYLAFASELKALATLPFIRSEIDQEVIDSYLSYLYVPAPLTTFQNIKRLMPGEYLEASGQQLSVSKYWRLPLKPDVKGGDKHELAEELFERIKDSVRLRLMSDVPLGVFLSGGLDSSALVACMHELGTRNIKTFSMGFGTQERYNETTFAKIVAKRFNTEHFELNTTPDIRTILPKIIACFDEPLADPAAIPLYQLAEFAAQRVKVVLCGDGGDELLGGYRRYIWDVMADKYKRTPALIRSIIRNGLKYLPASTRGVGKLVGLGRKFTQRAELEPALRYASWLSGFTTEFKKEYYQPDYLASLAESDAQADQFFEETYHEYLGDELLNRLNYVDLQTYLPYNLLEKIDRITMAHSLEARVPFLDHQLVEWAMGLGAQSKRKGLKTKVILRKALENRLPREILRRKKMGFGVPLEDWFKGDWFEYAREIVLDSQGVISQLMNRAALIKMFENHRNELENNCWRIYALVVLELWQNSQIRGE